MRRNPSNGMGIPGTSIADESKGYCSTIKDSYIILPHGARFRPGMKQPLQ
jgi:hypothetical protein